MERGCEECGHTGLLLVTPDNDSALEIQRCDACDHFANDNEAIKAAFALACKALDFRGTARKIIDLCEGNPEDLALMWPELKKAAITLEN